MQMPCNRKGLKKIKRVSLPPYMYSIMPMLRQLRFVYFRYAFSEMCHGKVNGKIRNEISRKTFAKLKGKISRTNNKFFNNTNTSS